MGETEGARREALELKEWKIEAEGSRHEALELYAFKREAETARRELAECQDRCRTELARCGSIHTRELRDLQQQVYLLQQELKERWAVVESDLSRSCLDTSACTTWLSQASPNASPNRAAPVTTDLETAVLELCERLEQDATSLP